MSVETTKRWGDRRRAVGANQDAARLATENARLRGALSVFAAMDAMDPPEGVPLNEWLPAVTGARAALRETEGG
jgi:ABC-type xylose transport system permease subunit